MNPMATVITTLYTLPRRKEWQAIDSTGKHDTWNDVVNVLCDYADCPRSAVYVDDNDLFCVEGIGPVGFIEREYVPMLMAAE
jgi:hypothetical protein